MASQPVTEIPPLLELRGVSKRYGDGDAQVVALDCVNLAIRAGEFVAITGPSGSGKSTGVSILGCLEQPSSGEYLIEGFEVQHLPPDVLPALRGSRLGFIFQSYNLLSRTSALDNVALPLIYADLPRAERELRAREALASVGLTGREEAKPNQLSGGQQQRVAIARAIVNQPEVLIADEPTGNLDSRIGQEIMGLIERLHSQSHITVVMVTHDSACAAWAQRQVVFKDGKIVSDSKRPTP